MSEAEMARFVAHYERLTRYMLDEMPGRADLVLWLNPDRSCARIQRSARKEDARVGSGRETTDSSEHLAPNDRSMQENHLPDRGV